MPRTWQMIATIALLFGINSRVLSTQAAEPETHSEAASTQAPPEATTNSHVPAAEVEAAINSLSQPIDNEQLSRIFQDLPQVADPKERERLQQLLDAKMQTTLEEPAARQEPLPDMAKIAAPSMEPPTGFCTNLTKRTFPRMLGSAPRKKKSPKIWALFFSIKKSWGTSWVKTTVPNRATRRGRKWKGGGRSACMWRFPWR